MKSDEVVDQIKSAIRMPMRYEYDYDKVMKHLLHEGSISIIAPADCVRKTLHVKAKKIGYLLKSKTLSDEVMLFSLKKGKS